MALLLLLCLARPCVNGAARQTGRPGRAAVEVLTGLRRLPDGSDAHLLRPASWHVPQYGRNLPLGCIPSGAGSRIDPPSGHSMVAARRHPQERAEWLTA